MRVLYKYNPGTKTYDPYTVPDDWKIPVCCTEPEAVINCAWCGKELKMWYSYESKEILFSPEGQKTLICMDCYYKELYQKRIVRKEVIEE